MRPPQVPSSTWVDPTAAIDRQMCRMVRLSTGLSKSIVRLRPVGAEVRAPRGLGSQEFG